MGKPRKKPFPGHKFMRLNRIFQADCECGWRSAMHVGKGGMGQAYAEFQGHIWRCEQAALAKARGEDSQ